MLTLPPEVDLATVPALHQQLVDLLMVEATIVLDASKIERLTTPGVQLLLATQQECARQKKSFSLIEKSPVTQQVLADLGVTQL